MMPPLLHLSMKAQVARKLLSDVIGVQQTVIHTFHMTLEVLNNLFCMLHIRVPSTQEALRGRTISGSAILTDECCHVPVRRVDGHVVVAMLCVEHCLDGVGGARKPRSARVT